MRNLMKLTLVVAMAFALTVALAPQAGAFHDDGVAHCNGCHTMHNSYGGEGMMAGGTGESVVHEDLLRGTTESDTCLRCHGKSSPSPFFNYNVLSPDLASPNKGVVGAGGGDFVFLQEANLNDGHAGATHPIAGERAGHNVIAPDFDIEVDTTLDTAPGGDYPSANLTCASCHDPHGGQQFRFLYWSGAKDDTSHSKADTGSDEALTYAGDEPIGIEISVGSTASQTNHNVYTENFSEFCDACHTDMHDAGALVHPTGATLVNGTSGNYNSYDGTVNGLVADPTVGPYLEVVPVEFDDATNVTTSSAFDVDATARVMCMTCHRAHASPAPSAGRWDFNITVWDEEGVESSSTVIPNPYAVSDPSGHQRSLCNKCHAQDIGDAG